MDFAELAAVFGAEVVWSEGGKVRAPQSFVIAGPAPITVYPELSEGECVAVLLEVEHPGTRELPRISLRREHGLDRGAKALGINREVQLGDADFDAAVYVESEVPDPTVQQALGSAPARAAALALLRGPCDELLLGSGRVIAHVTAEQLAGSQDPTLQTTRAQLLALRDALAVPRDIPSPTALAHRRGIGHVFGIAGLWLAVALVALLLRPPPTLLWGPVWAALGLGALLWLLCCGLLTWLLRGGADSLRWLLISAGFFLLVAPFAGMKLALTANAALDAPPTARSYPATLVEAGDAQVLLEVAGLRPDEPHTRLSVPKDRLRAALPEDLQQVTLVTGPGALGWAWLAAAGP
ncbi:MAG: hypothetical protein H0T76_12230 [Nannocystis sp.]|nr:hypothetical protein [Nannocystis sp.]MBA3547245.1 hypothetical protein [Nannocystis sp.]